MPLHRRIPKRGFHNLFQKSFAIVNVEMLNAFAAGETVSPEMLMGRRDCTPAQRRLKVLGDGDLKVALTVRAHAFSSTATEKITRAGGKVEVL